MEKRVKFTDKMNQSREEFTEIIPKVTENEEKFTDKIKQK